MDLEQLVQAYQAVYLSKGGPEGRDGALHSALGPGWQAAIVPSTGQVRGWPALYAADDFLHDGQPLVASVADGRRAAVTIGTRLRAEVRQA